MKTLAVLFALFTCTARADETWLESKVTVAADLDGTNVLSMSADARVLKDGFKGLLKIAGTDTPCDFIGQLSDSKTHVTQYYCYFEPEHFYGFLSSPEAIEILRAHFTREPLASVRLLINTDSQKPFYREETTSFSENGATLTLRAVVE